MMLDLFAAKLVVTLILLVILYWTRYRSVTWDTYYPAIAWVRGGIYFCCCYLLSYATGAMELILTSPIATEDQLANSNWILFTAGAALFIILAYAGVWNYYTPIFERKTNYLMSALFGFLWGSSSGQLFLSVWLIMTMFDWPVWAAWTATFLTLAAYQPNWHNIYWDHYIAPEHDTPMTQVIKASCCHIPNLLIMLTYLALYQNYALFVLAQVVACMSAGLGMRFPAPWAEIHPLNFAKRTEARIPRCTGYITEDYLSDPYTPFYRGWTGTRKHGHLLSWPFSI